MNPNTYLEMASREAHYWWFCDRRIILSHLIATFQLPPNARILEIWGRDRGYSSNALCLRSGQCLGDECYGQVDSLGDD